MALLVPVAGAYTGAYTPGSGASGAGTGAGSVGILSETGYTLSWVVHKQKIGNDGTDLFGRSLLAGIHLGGDWRMSLRCREYSITGMNLAWPYTKAANVALAPLLAGIGVEDTAAFAGALVLTAISGTSAASNPATLTALSVAPDEGQSSHLEFTSRLRELPMQLLLYPYVASGTYRWFTTT